MLLATMNSSPHWLFRFLLLLLIGTLAHAAPATEEIFEHFKDRIAQVQVIDLSAGSRVGYGSGFALGRADRIVTNYHVISKLVMAPRHHKAELKLVDGRVIPAELLAFDAVHDLAVLVPAQALPAAFELAGSPPPKGQRLYSLGVPNDLDFTIVEGTYNGLVGNTFHDRIHFTGAINSGMSGGPAIDAAGRLVGVNVAKDLRGDLVSFLVPAADVAALLAQPAPKGERRTVLRDQLLANQQSVVTQLLAQPMVRHPLGSFQLPGRFAEFMRCWGDAQRRDKQRYQQASYQCSNQDDVYLDDGFSTGTIALRHDWYGKGELNPLAFTALVNRMASYHNASGADGDDELGNYACQQAYVKLQGRVLKTAVCLRAFRKLGGLYDLYLKAVSVGDGREAVVSTLQLGGVTQANALGFARRYLEAMQ
ncbi:trypsin-like peptidase domain-containing protein [Chitinimonas arctica]|uniref:Trypsin-like peptidase domain-containing protein n=1 Tax=Chitinimonas arctica TaxID=2594795 RepID=A0A516SDB8_9NEIS|nr:serine protease [Chitinimonas arctica]QDQ26155.1 trypsin-like peptidase domain-containing protein [Chitinimonas arctica]